MALRHLVSKIATVNPLPVTATHHRLLRPSTTSYYKIESNRDSKNSKDEFEYNVFTTKGPNMPHFQAPIGNGYLFRLDMPGIRNSDLKTSISGPKLSISAQEPKPHLFGLGQLEPRFYEVELQFDPTVYNIGKAKAEVKNGVLWVLVPYSAGSYPPSLGWVHCHIGRVKVNMDASGNYTGLVLNESDGTWKIVINK